MYPYPIRYHPFPHRFLAVLLGITLFIPPLCFAQTFTLVSDSPVVKDSSDSNGSAWGDYDNDGDLDLFVATKSDQKDLLYANDGSGTFSKVTTGALVTDSTTSSGAGWGDYDNDGFLDLFVTGELNRLYHNNGDGSFTEIAEGSGVNEGPSSSGRWGDYDNDGFIDLFVANRDYKDNYLYHNSADGTFWKILEGDIVCDDGVSNSGSWCDYDNDGDLDLFVANTIYQDNSLYQNNGNGTFSPITEGDLVNDSGRGSGIAWGDYDNDGNLDLFVANARNDNNFLYHNEGDGTFTKVTSGEIVSDGGYSIGCSWGDYDNDGDLDLFVANREGEGDFFYINNGNGTFTRDPSELAGNSSDDSRDGIWGDVDNDGDLDLFVAVSGSNDRLYINNGNSNNWVNIRCVGIASNTSAIGTKVRVKATINSLPIWQLREISDHSGRHGQNSLRAAFGLGDATTIDSIVVEWPSGTVDVRTDIAVNQFLTIHESLFSPFVPVTTGPVVTDGNGSTGAAWGDYDGDGDLDLFVSRYTRGNFLYTNNGDGTFTKVTSSPMVTLGDPSWGASWGDYDNDGDLDLFVANSGHSNFLYTNNGDGTFTKVESGSIISPEDYSVGGTWGDYDNDGDLDLFVANHGNNRLYRNNGDGSFSEITDSPVVSDGGSTEGGSWADYDKNGYLDLFVANTNGEDNFLYHNNGDGTFTKVMTGPIVTDGGNSRGGSWGDYDNDGDLDLFVTNYNEDNFLYTNDGDGNFTKVTEGVVVSESGISHGAGWGDMDNDGDLDLFVVNNVYENNFLYQNRGNGTFSRITTGPVVADSGNFFSGAWGDYDNDGDLDLFVTNSSGNNCLYTNEGNSYSWLNISLVGTISNTSAIGARVRVKATIGGAPFWQLREISGLTGWSSQNSLRAHFGLRNASTIDSVIVEWPSGIVQILTGVDMNQFLTIEEVDPQGPSIKALIISTQPTVQQPLTVRVNVTDVSGVQSVVFRYMKGDESDYSMISMSDLGESTYLATIPGSRVTLYGIACYINAQDMIGNVSRTDTFSIRIAFPEDTLSTSIPSGAFTSGFPKDKWRLISIPAELDDPDVLETFGDELGRRTKKTWRFFSLEGGEYIENPADITTGEGYWLYQRASTALTFKTGSGITNDLTGVELVLDPGWNFIGSPYSFIVPINIDQGRFYGPITYAYDEMEGWSDVVTELLPWGGYAVYNRGITQETILIDALASSGTVIPKAYDDRLQGWRLQLKAAGQTYADVNNYVGRQEGADEELDHFDNPEPPYIDGYVSLALERPEWGNDLTRFTSDIRSYEEVNGVWDMDIFTKGESGPIRLTSKLEGEVPSDFRVVLLDVVTRQLHDLYDETHAVTITGYREEFPYHLKAVAGSQAWVDAEVQEILAQLPAEFALSQNYPNPFNPSTRIKYTVPRPEKVSLRVYNILGQEVVILVNDWTDLGEHEVMWDSMDKFGRDLPSGIYIARLTAPGHASTIKMLILK